MRVFYIPHERYWLFIPFFNALVPKFTGAGACWCVRTARHKIPVQKYRLRVHKPRGCFGDRIVYVLVLCSRFHRAQYYSTQPLKRKS